MALISITRLRIRSIRFLPGFFYQALLSNRQARRAQGNISTDALSDANWTFWTRSAWSDESAMRSFMMAAPHRDAMPKLLHWCDEAATVHWNQESSTLPAWNEAHRRLLQDGRRSKVNHPSENQEAFRIPLPNAGRIKDS